MDRGASASGFLSLIPDTSDSYPSQPVNAEPNALQSRRASSVSTDTSANQRFLKLGPVHWGEHLDEHKGDWCAVEEAGH